MCAPFARCAVCLYGVVTDCSLPIFPLAHFMCEKWKEIKAISFFQAGVGCGSPRAGGGAVRLAVKYRRACRVWEVYGAPRVAKNNRGNCWSKAATTGRGERKVVQALDPCDRGAPSTFTSDPSCSLARLSQSENRLAVCVSLASADEKSFPQTQLQLLRLYTTDRFFFFHRDLEMTPFFSNLNANGFEDIACRKVPGASLFPAIWWQHKVSTCLRNLKCY